MTSKTSAQKMKLNKHRWYNPNESLDKKHSTNMCIDLFMAIYLLHFIIGWLLRKIEMRLKKDSVKLFLLGWVLVIKEVRLVSGDNHQQIISKFK